MKFTLVSSGSASKTRPAAKILRFILRLLIVLLILLTFLCIWAVRNFDNISLEEVIFYSLVPLKGTAQQFTRTMLKQVVFPFCVLTVCYLLSILLPRKKELRICFRSGRSFRLLPLRFPLPAIAVLIIVWGCTLYLTGDRLLDITGFINGQLSQSNFIEEHYVDPAKTALTFPEKKRNLITIYIESEESSYQDTADGGLMEENYIPELTALAKENTSFSQNDLISGAAVAPACGWTIAGMVAQTAGIPLKFYEYGDIDNWGGDFESFLPGATMLGDILKEQGYQNVFLCGSDFEFGGRRLLYTQHGNYSIYDHNTAIQKGWIPEGYYYGWGMEDKYVYQHAKELVTELYESGKPFHFGIMTADTHEPGWICDLCPDTDESDYARAVRCSSRQAADFVEWCKQQPFYENTTIVVTGDHATMETKFCSTDQFWEMEHLGTQKRLVYNVFVNPAVQPVQEKNRKFTTMDFFPTVLAAMGVTIDGDRLGLGTNLFSACQTLSEEVGYDTLYDELNKKSDFYDLKLLH